MAVWFYRALWCFTADYEAEPVQAGRSQSNSSNLMSVVYLSWPFLLTHSLLLHCCCAKLCDRLVLLLNVAAVTYLPPRYALFGSHQPGLHLFWLCFLFLSDWYVYLAHCPKLINKGNNWLIARTMSSPEGAWRQDQMYCHLFCNTWLKELWV